MRGEDSQSPAIPASCSQLAAGVEGNPEEEAR